MQYIYISVHALAIYISPNGILVFVPATRYVPVLIATFPFSISPYQ